ncbi:MAG TPA: hypothetical protein VEU33_06475 [Archangium sp.]|nr:hypothetical protein [Archangium sp.]
MVASALGPKITDGEQSDLESIQLVVTRKRGERGLGLARRIPKELDGIPTDVVRLDGELTERRFALSAPIPGLGLGTPVVTDDGWISTLAAAGVDVEGNPMLLGCAHGIGQGRTVIIDDDDSRELGRCTTRIQTLFGRELGPGWNASERFLIDASVVSLPKSIRPTPGLLGKRPYRIARPSRVANRLKKVAVAALSPRRQTWLEGTVIGLWPRPHNPQMRFTGLCLVEHQPLGNGGDSGTMWMAFLNGQPTAIGTHFGLDWAKKSAPRLAFVSLALEALEYLEIAQLQ